MPSAKERNPRIEAGLCASCGQTPPAPGVLDCDDCREKQAERNRKAREKNPGYFIEAVAARWEAHKAVGLCIQCDEKALPGQRKCDYHRRLANERIKRYRDSLRAEKAA